MLLCQVFLQEAVEQQWQTSVPIEKKCKQDINFLLFSILFYGLTVQRKAVLDHPWKSSPKMLKNSTTSQINQPSFKKWTNIYFFIVLDKKI